MEHNIGLKDHGKRLFINEIKTRLSYVFNE